MIRAFVFAVLCVACLPALAQDASCRGLGRRDIVRIFDQGIALNEQFKQALRRPDKEAAQRLRQALEKQSEERVMPCVRRAAERMAKDADPVLMRKLLELLVSYENAADETMSTAMGMLFAKDPAAVERASKAFPADARKLIAQRIQAGWSNLRPDLPPARRKKLDARLQHMLSSTNGPAGAAH